MSVKPSLRGHAPHGCHPTTAAHRSRRMQEQIKIPGMPPSFFPFYTTNLFNHHIRSIPQPHSYQHTLTNTHTHLPTNKSLSTCSSPPSSPQLLLSLAPLPPQSRSDTLHQCTQSPTALQLLVLLLQAALDLLQAPLLPSKVVLLKSLVAPLPWVSCLSAVLLL